MAEARARAPGVRVGAPASRGLRQGATYRVVVKYRWTDAGGEVIADGTAALGPVQSAGRLPNLRVASIESRRGEVEETAVYRVTIVNRGATAAQGVGVLLRVDGEIVDEAVVIDVARARRDADGHLQRSRLSQRMRVVVDPKDLIAEAREEDNVARPSCL